ncbi:DMT family transporter [Novosphingopyxis baekryungensis]|uniref:DMT family transporter n=1 Tax=Novosphingopyxis baekryungensis TaxID=279369 RepID=UPI0003B39DD4|nr:DMT family transporter [Novosphingopyxis baekryungensis]
MNDKADAPADEGPELTLFSPRILLPFLLVALIWGGTWIVIRDQISSVPPTWSVCYRFTVAVIGMAVLARVRGQPFLLPRSGHVFALLIGASQFMLNFNFVYHAERFVTSGLVATLFALLMLPNALLGRVFLGRKLEPSFFIGTAIAIGGISLLFVQEYRAMPASGLDVLYGVLLTVGGILSASCANVLQAAKRVQALPLLTLLAWAMFYGVLFNAAVALATAGPPSIDPRTGYWLGILYLGLLGSVVTFPLYFGIVRAIGPGKAAYNSTLVPVVAMALSTLFEGYRWSLLAGAGGVIALIGLLVAMRARPPRTPRVSAG